MGSKTQLSRGIRSCGALAGSAHHVQHRQPSGKYQHIFRFDAHRHTHGIQHFTARDGSGGQDQRIRCGTLAQQHRCAVAQRFFQQRDHGHCLAVLIQQHPQHFFPLDVCRVCQQIRGPFLPQMTLQCLAHAQHAGSTVGHLQGNAHALCHRQAGEQVGILPGKGAQRLAGAIGKMVGHGTAAHQRSQVAVGTQKQMVQITQYKR